MITSKYHLDLKSVILTQLGGHGPLRDSPKNVLWSPVYKITSESRYNTPILNSHLLYYLVILKYYIIMI